MSADKNITIKFLASGDDKLITAFKQLAAAQGKFNKVSEDTTVKGKKLNKALVDMTVAIKKSGNSWKKLGIDAKTIKRAFDGNTGATRKLTAAYKLMQAQQHKASISTRILGGSFAVLRSKLLIYSFAATLVNRVFISMVKTFSNQEAVNKKLQIGLSNIQGTTEGVTQRLLDYSSALQQATSFGDELITNGMAQLTTFGLNEASIKSLTPQILNVARAIQTTSGSMPDLNSLFIAFGKSTTTAVSALTRYGVVLTDTEKAQLGAMDANERAGEIAKILDRQYGGLAEAFSKTTAGMLDAAAAARGDAAEAFGEVLAPAVLKVSEALKFIAEKTTAQNIKILGASALIAAAGVGALSLAAWVSAGGFASLAAAILAAQASLIAFSVTATISTGGLWAIGLALGVAAAAALKYFNVFGKTQDMEDAEKRMAKAAAAAIELSEAEEALIKSQESGVLSLQKKLDLLNATSEIEKMHINLGHEANLQEIALILKIVEKTEAIEKEKEAKEALIQLEKDNLKIQADLIKAEKAIFDAKMIFTSTIAAQKQALNDNMITAAEKILIVDARILDLQRMVNVEGSNKLSLQNQLIAAIKEKAQLEGDALEVELTKIQLSNIAISQVGAMSSAFSKKHSAEMQQMKAGDEYKNASRKKQQALEKGVLEGQAKEKRRIAIADKTASLATAGMNTYTAVTKAWAQGGIFGGVMAVIAAAAGAAQISAIAATPIPKFARGGSVGGRRHSAGGTMIEAEQGEFIMSRNAVDSIGLEAMNRINAGGGGGSVNINFTGNVMSQDFIEDEAIPMIKEAIRRGADIGVA